MFCLVLIVIARRFALNDRNGVRLRANIETRAATYASFADVNRELIAHAADRFPSGKDFFGAKFDAKTAGFAKFRFDNNIAGKFHVESHHAAMKSMTLRT